MCGIIGQVSSSFNQGRIVQGLEAIDHRGPDANGSQMIQVAEKCVWLGHSRLSILDLSASGAQPMRSHDERWWVSFNGEIYNHQEIRAQLQCSFRGTSDTETLIESLARLGIQKTLPLLNGMYAFAALDRKEKKLYLVRDPYGIKPLYLHQDETTVTFCSELEGLSAMGVDLTVSPQGLDGLLTLRYVPSPQTLLQGIKRIPPGHVLTVDLVTGKQNNSMFIQASQDRFPGSFEDAVQEYQRNLAEAVQRQLLSDVPVGLLLSGGIDSALIAAMAKDAGTELMGFTVGFGKGHDECEISDAEHTAAILSLPHRYVTVNPEQLWRAIPNIVAAVEEPLGTDSVLPMWYLVEKAREEVTVVLTGQGSDEPWGGYRRYQLELWRQRAPSSIWGGLASFPVDQISSMLPSFISKGLRSIPKQNPIDRFISTYELFTPLERQKLTGRDSSLIVRQRIEAWLAWQAKDISFAEQMMRIDTRLNLADDLLLYGDKLSMAVALEARVPMLDIKLMEFIESLPLEYRVTLRETKRVHKAMAEQFLPAEIVHRPKKGFQVPFAEWSRGIWKDRIADVLFASGAPHFEYVERKAIERLWQDHLNKRPDRFRQIFSLLMFAEWTKWIQSLRGTTVS